MNKSETEEKLMYITFKVLFIIQICKLAHLRVHEYPLKLLNYVFVSIIPFKARNIAVYAYFYSA